MANIAKIRRESRLRRHRRVRKKIHGTAERPRLSIMLSSRNMYVQFIDDEKGVTLASASTLNGDGKTNIAAAKALGQKAGKAACEKGNNVDQQLKNAVLQAHEELRQLKHQLH